MRRWTVTRAAVPLALLAALALTACGPGMASPTPAPLPVASTAAQASAVPVATATPAPTPSPTFCLEAVAAPSPTPRPGRLRIAYWNSGRLWLWREETGTASPFPLPEGAADAQLSADGRLVAFRRVVNAEKSELWAVDAGGANPRRLAVADAHETLQRYPDAVGAILAYDWLPDTHSLWFRFVPSFNLIGMPPSEAVRLADADTGAVRTVIPPGEVYVFDYAPDGSQVATVAAGELRLIAAGDGHVQFAIPLPTVGTDFGNMAYSPDSRYLAVYTRPGISIVDAQGGSRRDVALAYEPIGLGESVYMPPIIWLRDAPAFYTVIGKGSTYEELLAPDASFTIWRIDAAKGSAAPVGTFRGSALSVSLSPDLKRIASWTQEPNGTRHLYLAQVETGKQILYVTKPVLEFAGWNPDSDRFLYRAAGSYLGGTCQAPSRVGSEGPGTTLEWVDAGRYLTLVANPTYDEWKVTLHTLSGEATFIGTLDAGGHHTVYFGP